MKLKMIKGKIVNVDNNKNSIYLTKKYKRFLELCSMSVKIEDIKPGFICYDNLIKHEITSLPYYTVSNNILVVDCKTVYESEFTVMDDFISLSDANIIGGGYNLYRLFESKWYSMEYNKIRKSYEYYDNSLYDYSMLQYKIEPISGDTLDENKYKFETRQITKFL
jgi:hypothetical protein